MLKFSHSHSNTSAKQLAVTLIEMLLVISVVAAMSVGGIQMVRNQADNSKVDKVILQLQNVSLAARNYYESQLKWPTVSELTSYMPSSFAATNLTNPWGQAVTFNAGPPFAVQTNVPSAKIAKKIALKLPFAVYDPACTTTCTFNTYLTMPGRAAWQLGYARMPIISSITPELLVKSTDDEFDIPLPTDCGAGYTPKAVAGVQSFGREGSPDLTQWIGQFALCTTNSNDDVCIGYKPSSPNKGRIHMWGSTSPWNAWAKLFIVNYCEVSEGA